MTTQQLSLFGRSEEVCRVCSHFSRFEQRNYCKYYSAFLEDSTLLEPCNFLDASK